MKAQMPPKVLALINAAFLLAVFFVFVHEAELATAPYSSRIQLKHANYSEEGVVPTEFPVAWRGRRTDKKLLFAGDIMQHRNQMFDRFSETYARVSELVRQADFAVANLEFPVVPEEPTGPPPKSVHFNGSVRHVKALREAGFDVLSVANNHAFDHRERGLESTRQILSSSGFLAMGLSTQEGRQGVPVILELERGRKVAILGYTYTVNVYRDGGEVSGVREETSVLPELDFPVAMLPLENWQGLYRELGKKQLAGDLQRAKSEGAEFVVAYVHWGAEWQFFPTASQRQAAQDMVELGFGLVVGSHSHVLGEIEVYKDTPIVYSLGNLVSGFSQVELRTAAFLEVGFNISDTGIGLSSFRLIPTLSDRRSHVVEVLSGSDSAEKERAWALVKSVFGGLESSFMSSAP